MLAAPPGAQARPRRGVTLPAAVTGNQSSESIERAFDRAAGGWRSVGGNRVTMLLDGPQTFGEMLKCIAAARTRIHLENYIFRDDVTGQRFADALMARARAGVKVRVLYDWFGSVGTSRRFWRKLREAGIEVLGFSPPRLHDSLLFLSRDHRKVFVVDGSTAVTGGLCIGDEWSGNAAKQQQPWRDTAVMIEGPAARLLDQAFHATWQYADGDPFDDAKEVPSDVSERGDSSVRVIASEPGRERAARAIDLILALSAERIWVTEAYLAFSQRVFQAFIDAARDGVDVRLLVPGTSDVRVIRNITRVNYRALLQAGVRIWEWNGPMIHAKTIVSDGSFVRVGSSNLNPSSLLTNWELDVVSEDSRLALAFEHQFLNDLARSSEITLRDRRVPKLLSRRVPKRFARELPTEKSPNPHRRSLHEFRMEATRRAKGVLLGARGAVFGPLGIFLLVAAALFAIFPVPMAIGAAAVSGMGGIALLVRSWGHRVAR